MPGAHLWYWGRAMSHDKLLCFMSSGRAPGGQRYPDEVNGLLVIDKGEFVLATNQVEFKALDLTHNDRTKKDIPRRMEFRTLREGCEVTAAVDVKQMMASADYSSRSKYVSAYLRLLADFKANIDLRGMRSEFSGDVVIGDMIFY